MTVMESSVYSCQDEKSGVRKRMPFIRICGTNPDERQKIAEALHQALPQMDIEVLAIEKFIPGTP